MMCLCARCGGMAHPPEQCPCVKAVEYYENGTVKRIEYHERLQPISFVPATIPPVITPWMPNQDIISGISVTNNPGVEVTQTWCGVNS